MKTFKILLILLALPSLGFIGPRSTSGLVASQDVLASSTDAHDVGTTSNVWRSGYFNYSRFKETSEAPDNKSGFGSIYVKSADELPYYVDDGGTEFSITSADPSNLKTVVDSTASTTLTTVQSGRIFTNTLATGSIDYALPSITSGMNYSFSVTDEQRMNIRPATGEFIRLIRDASGDIVTVPSSLDRIMASSVGSSIVLTTTSDDNWTVFSQNGEWINIS